MFQIEGRPLAPQGPVWIVAELGVNHNGDPALAAELLRRAKESGADAAKIQLFVPEELASPQAGLCRYQRDGEARDQLELLKSLALAPSAAVDLREEAERLRLPLWASVFDFPSLELALELNFPVIKIGSGELTCTPLHEAAARSGKPVVFSCGMATVEEIRPVVDLYLEKRTQVVLLHCVSAYPTREETVNLRAIPFLRRRFGIPIGFSDHTRGLRAAPLAVAAGAVLVEKHFTLNRSLPGPDHKSSLTPERFRVFVRSIRRAEIMLGREEKTVTEAEKEIREKVRKSIVLARPVPAGKKLEPSDLAFRRPGTGISPAQFPAVLGRPPRRDLPAGHVLKWEDL